jgi:hypothetical protein
VLDQRLGRPFRHDRVAICSLKPLAR